MVDFNKLADSLIQFYQSDGEIQSREVGVLEELYNLDYFWDGTDHMTQLAAAVNSAGVVDASDDLSLFSPDDQKTLRDLIGEKPFVARAAIIMRKLQTVSTHAEADQVMAEWYQVTLNRPLPMRTDFAEDIGKGLKHYLEFPGHHWQNVESALDLLQLYNQQSYYEAFQMYVPQVTTPAEFREKVLQSPLPVVLLDVQEVHPRGAFYLGRIYFGQVRFVSVDRSQFSSGDGVNIYDYFSTQPRKGMVEDYVTNETSEQVISMEWVLIRDGRVIKRIVDRDVNDGYDPMNSTTDPIKKYFGVEIPNIVAMDCKD